jgi:hypothetical protein
MSEAEEKGPHFVRSPDETDCPGFADHTVSPKGYLAWHDWAKRTDLTHRQVRCQRCGLYAIWLPKPPLDTEKTG